MPLFEYRCNECGNEFEVLIRSQEKASCPQCNSEQLQKLLSPAATPASGGDRLPIACPPSDAPPCGPGCCRMT